MGRSLLVAAKGMKAKKARPSKVAQQLADSKHMGDEPEVRGHELGGAGLLAALNWYNYMCTRHDAREYLQDYLKSKGRTGDLRELKRVPDAWVNLQAGWMARIMTRGGRVDMDRFELRLKEMLSKAGVREESDEEETPKPVKTKPDIQTRMSDKASDVMGELEELIDREGYTVDVYEFLTRRQVPTQYARRIRDFFKPVADEAQELVGRDPDPQLLEGYGRLTKAQRKQRAEFYSKLIADCERFADVAKKQRVVRKKKVVSSEKKLKNLKFQRESKEYKLASIKPEKLLGAEELFMFNTKYRVLTQLVALDRGGLDVKGTSVANYDEERSRSYRVGRKTEQYLETALKGGKRAVTKMLGELKTCGLQYRVNENTVLLRV
jgi:hypothetical protein